MPGPAAIPPSVTSAGARRLLAQILAAVVLVVLVVLHGTGAPALAQTGRSAWGVQPADTEHGTGRPNFVYQLEPGDVVEDALVVVNTTGAPLTLRVYAADGFTTSTGFLDLLPDGEPSVGVGRWVAFATDELVLAADERVEVPFTLTVPDDARPGDHSGGVVTSVRTEAATSGVIQDNRLGSRIHVRVAGDLHTVAAVEDLEVTYRPSVNPFAPGSLVISYEVANAGNVRIAGTEVVTVAGVLGLDRKVVTAPLPELVTDSTLPREVVVPGVWPLLRRTAEVEVVPTPVGLGSTDLAAPAVPVAVSAMAWTVPWVLVGLVALVVVAALLRGRRRAQSSDDAGGAVSGDDAGSAASSRARTSGQDAPSTDTSVSPSSR